MSELITEKMAELQTETTPSSCGLALAAEVTPSDGIVSAEATPNTPSRRLARRRASVGEAGVKRGSVGRESDVKAVAGFVAMTLRSEGRLELLAAGPRAVNRAVKAVCLARKYLDADAVDLVVDPEFLGCDEKPANNEAVLKIAARPAAEADRSGDVEFNVAGASKPGAVAGAVASALRRGEGVTAYAMGDQAVTRGLKACWKAGIFLADASRGPTVRFLVQPEFCAPAGDDTYSTKIAFRFVPPDEGAPTRAEAA